MKSTLRRAEDQILAAFDAPGPRAYTLHQLDRILADRREEWDLAGRIRVGHLWGFLDQRRGMTPIDIVSSGKQIAERWTLGAPSALGVAISLVDPKGYLSHASAMYLHGLLEDEPKRLYVNREQAQKWSDASSLSQSRIDQAFSCPQRASRQVFTWGEVTFVLLNGKQTGRYGVKATRGPRGELLDATDLPRTLIDVTVRPAYGGEVQGVARAFQKSVGRVSIDEIVETLRAVKHVYPYHQAIGYYLERAGYSARDLEPLRKLGLKYKFYLGHEMKEKAFDPSWQVYHPREM